MNETAAQQKSCEAGIKPRTQQKAAYMERAYFNFSCISGNMLQNQKLYQYSFFDNMMCND